MGKMFLCGEKVLRGCTADYWDLKKGYKILVLRIGIWDPVLYSYWLLDLGSGSGMGKKSGSGMSLETDFRVQNTFDADPESFILDPGWKN
jgi:hypothetical protein